ncbi:PAS domain S-box protein [Nocardioides faecalis]|uniref:PAS domain S-box protein n=1 Tax=Nocardioides faecalis TaxID=2803858 RepID=UPI0027DDB6C3|nr:PAS domain S-box protein [Nocardioides faecalis]
MAPTLPTLVLVDDAVEVRTLVRARLRLAGRIEVVAEGGTGLEAVELAERLQPDLMLLDVSMPGMDGLEALPRIREVSPRTRIAMYSGFVEDGLAERTIERGATRFLEKSTSLETLSEELLAMLEADLGVAQVVADDTDDTDAADAAEAPGPSAVPGFRGGRASRGADPLGSAWRSPTVASELLAQPVLGAGTWVGEATTEPVLREHLERFREVFEDAAIGMATMTLAGRVVRANPALARLTGRSLPELVAMPYADLAGPDADRVRQVLEQVSAGTRDAVQVEHALETRDDQRLLATLSPVRDASSRPLYLFLQVQDVSAQREMEEELRRSEQRFRLLVEAVRDYAIFMLDPDGRVASWNAGAQRIKGWTESEIVGRHFRTFYPRDKQASRHPEHELEMATRDGSYEEEGWRIRKDGSTFWAHVTITAVRDADGTLVGFAKVTRDVTERMWMLREQERSANALAEANAALASANQRLREAAEDQAQFLAVTAHELRSPVGVLGGTAALLQKHWDTVPETERRELFQAMASGADRLQRLLNDLLTASRVGRSTLSVQTESVELATDLAGRLQSSLLGAPGQVEVRFDPGLRVLADPDRLAQMVENLVRNALQHGAAPVVVANEPGAEPGFVDVVVRDAGGGVPEAMRARLFEFFATGSKEGTGLGLYLVRALARAQGGDARYRAEDSAFVVTLPRPSEDEGSRR